MVPLSYDGVGDRLVAAVPELDGLLRAHLDFHDQLLAHVLFGDVVVMMRSWDERTDRDVRDRLAVFMDNELRHGDERAINAVQASFVEAIDPTDPTQRRFIDSWPAGLRAEAIRQRDWRA
jgi:hypothetical protein